MCSTRAQRIAQIGRAIDDLAAQAESADTPGGSAADAENSRAADASGQSDDIFARLAELWAQLAQLDPEVAKRLPTYEA